MPLGSLVKLIVVFPANEFDKKSCSSATMRKALPSRIFSIVFTLNLCPDVVTGNILSGVNNTSASFNAVVDSFV